MLETILVGVFVVALAFYGASFMGTSGSRAGKRCTAKTEGTLKKVIDESRGDSGSWFCMEYMAGDTLITNNIPMERVEGLNLNSPEGTVATVWYDPEKPNTAIVGDDPTQAKTKESWMKIRKFSLRVMMISSVLVLINSCINWFL